MDNSVFFLKTISDIFTAGGAIIAFSLLIYVITFKLKDSVTRSFGFLLSCIVIILGTDAFFTTTTNPRAFLLLLRLQYIGLIVLPSAYFLFSNALLSITGKPSRGKRKIFGIFSFIASAFFVYLNFANRLFLDIAISNSPVPIIQRTSFFDFFSMYFVLVMVSVWYNFIRAFKRTASRQSKRRMFYLVVAALGPALGSFPYLLYGSRIIASYPSIFWLISIVAYFIISVTIVVMTYTVSFFGLPWPDRIIKSRLFKWIMRGPATAILTLGVTTLITRLGKQYGFDSSALVILGMVAAIVVFEFSITLFSPYLEKLFFFGTDREELEKIRRLENRLLTKNDLHQFLELILATFCDQLQVENAFLSGINGKNQDLWIQIGRIKPVDEIRSILIKTINEKGINALSFTHDNGLVFPITHENDEKNIVIGFIYCQDLTEDTIDDEKKENIHRLLARAETALFDHQQQEEIMDSLEIITPQVSAIQNLLATSRFNRSKIIDGNVISSSDKFEDYIKDALGHFYGGPRLSQSPIINLNIVQNRISVENETAIMAIRAILHQAIRRLKPAGERQYTNEWVLFNILDLKFMEGWKVRDLCRKLSLSEADFYRKQRIAIAAIADQLLLMEQEFGK